MPDGMPCFNAEQMEKTVFFETADLFNLEVDLIFYDTTTASFSVVAKTALTGHPTQRCASSATAKRASGPRRWWSLWPSPAMVFQ